jgi:5-methyltetrahydropteroyltriglutamate--homocysteine methyltransferase
MAKLTLTLTLTRTLNTNPYINKTKGPVTIINWSFPRKDITRSEQAYQVALALRDEVADLEAAGCRIIQVDDPAIREGRRIWKWTWTRDWDRDWDSG